MNCGDCGTKLIVISSNHGVIVFCPKCTPNAGKAFMKSREKKLTKIIVEGQTPISNKEGRWKQLLKIDLNVLRKLKTPHKFRHDLRIRVEESD